MLPTFSLSKLFSVLLNLALENASNTDIAQLEQRSFAIAIDELPQDIGIRVEGGKIHPLSDDDIPNADVTISGNIKAILNMVQERDGLENDELYIAGKISTAKYFQQLLSGLSIDWKSFFGKFMPPEAAQKSADAFAQGLHFAKASKDQALEGLKKYLLEDKKLFVSQQEFTELKSGIQQIHDRIDQLIKQLDTQTGE